MSLEQMQSYFGFSRLPFDRRIAPGCAISLRSHQEARARIQFLISQGALGLICGEVGAGKTCAARAAVAGLDAVVTRSSTSQTRRSARAGSTARSSRARRRAASLQGEPDPPGVRAARAGADRARQSRWSCWLTKRICSRPRSWRSCGS